MATLINAKSTRPDIKAAFPMHPCPAVEAGTPSLLGHLTVPRAIALATGTADTVCIWGGVEDYYNRITAPKKLYFNLDFATHLEPCNPFPKRYNPWVRGAASRACCPLPACRSPAPHALSSVVRPTTHERVTFSNATDSHVSLSSRVPGRLC
jgi:hypothetical protein